MFDAAQAALKGLFRENSNTLGTFARIGALSALGATLTVLAYAGLQQPTSALLIPGFPRGPFQSGIVSGMGARFTEPFPAQIRASVGGFSYNFGVASARWCPRRSASRARRSAWRNRSACGLRYRTCWF